MGSDGDAGLRNHNPRSLVGLALFELDVAMHYCDMLSMDESVVAGSE